MTLMKDPYILIAAGKKIKAGQEMWENVMSPRSGGASVGYCFFNGVGTQIDADLSGVNRRTNTKKRIDLLVRAEMCSEQHDVRVQREALIYKCPKYKCDDLCTKRHCYRLNEGT